MQTRSTETSNPSMARECGFVSDILMYPSLWTTPSGEFQTNVFYADGARSVDRTLSLTSRILPAFMSEVTASNSKVLHQNIAFGFVTNHLQYVPFYSGP